MSCDNLNILTSMFKRSQAKIPRLRHIHHGSSPKPTPTGLLPSTACRLTASRHIRMSRRDHLKRHGHAEARLQLQCGWWMSCSRSEGGRERVDGLTPGTFQPVNEVRSNFKPMNVMQLWDASVSVCKSHCSSPLVLPPSLSHLSPPLFPLLPPSFLPPPSVHL